MDLKELRYIVTIADSGSISAAAQKLFMAQSSLSQFLQLYEAELGTSLFYRTSKGVRPTSSGSVFISHARQILQQYHLAQSEIWDIEGLNGGQIEFGISTFRGVYLIPRILKEFRTLYPNVHVEITEMDSADLENLMNEAAIITAKDGRFFINQNDIRQAFIKTGIGEEKKSKVISEKEKKITAYHEAGHAILFHLLPEMGPVHTISIIPTGMGAAGYTMPLPEQDEMFNSKKKMLENIVVDLGGRVAEELIFHDITTGASQDIKQATQMARAMVTQYGMSEKVGMIQYGGDENEVFIGRDFGHTKNYADQTAALIDSEVKRIIDESYEKAKEILSQNEEVLHKCAALLIQKEKIGREEFEALF